MKPFTICVATEQHLPYVEAVVSALEEVNRLTGNGVPFRDAYRAVGKAVEDGSTKDPWANCVWNRFKDGSRLYWKDFLSRNGSAWDPRRGSGHTGPTRLSA